MRLYTASTFIHTCMQNTHIHTQLTHTHIDTQSCTYTHARTHTQTHTFIQKGRGDIKQINKNKQKTYKN